MSANFTGVTFAKQKVTPSDDAIIRRAILPDGILYGCELTYSGSTLTMAAGQLLICGRQIRHPSSQNWAVVDATSGYARLLITVDLTKTATKEAFEQVIESIEYASSEDGFPDLDQADINVSGSRYQVVACVVSLGAGGITGIVSQLRRSVVDGSGSLNFSVVGGLAQPTDQYDNAIWVYTDVNITSWLFTATEPKTPEEGMVQFGTATTSPIAFNALKKNGIQVCPVFAKQYIDGAWIDVPAKIYQNGEWVDFYDGELYLYGNEYEDITGGWALSSNYSSTHGDVLTKSEYSMTFESAAVGGSHYACGFLRANNKINLADVNSLILIVKSVSLDSEKYPINLCVKTTDNASEADVVASIGLTSGGEQTFTLDVGALNGTYYVGIESDNNWGGKVEILCFKIK